MLYGLYYCRACHQHFIIESPVDFCNCGSVDVYMKKYVPENKVEATIEEIKSQGMRMLGDN